MSIISKVKTGDYPTFGSGVVSSFPPDTEGYVYTLCPDPDGDVRIHRTVQDARDHNQGAWVRLSALTILVEDVDAALTSATGMEVDAEAGVEDDDPLLRAAFVVLGVTFEESVIVRRVITLRARLAEITGDLL